MFQLVDPKTGHLRTVIQDPNMRTLADALHKLHGKGGITENCPAEIKTAPLRLPNGEITFVIAVIGTDTNGHTWQIAVPCSKEMRARNTIEIDQLYEVSVLDGGTVDLDGKVDLADGTSVHAVEFLPTPMHYELTDLQKTIVERVVHVLGAEERCRPYRALGKEGPYQRSEPEDWFKHIDGLDYWALSQLVLPPLNVIEYRVAKEFPTLTRQSMTRALSNAGIPLPTRSRRRVA